MIVTLTPNPSIDRTIEMDALHRGAVLRAPASRVDPGGKGVNVSRALAATSANHGGAAGRGPRGRAAGALLAALASRWRASRWPARSGSTSAWSSPTAP